MKNLLCMLGFHKWRYIPPRYWETRIVLNTVSRIYENVFLYKKQRWCTRCTKRQISRWFEDSIKAMETYGINLQFLKQNKEDYADISSI